MFFDLTIISARLNDAPQSHFSAEGATLYQPGPTPISCEAGDSAAAWVVAHEAGCECFRAGGVVDHVHLALRMARTVTVAQLVEELKTSSSKWLKTQSRTLTNFAWQAGYGAFRGVSRP